MSRKTILILSGAAALAVGGALALARLGTPPPTPEPPPRADARRAPGRDSEPVHDIEPPVGDVAPDWPEVSFPPIPREMRLPAPEPTQAPEPERVESALVETRGVSLLADPTEGYDAFAHRVLAERERGVEVVYVVERSGAPSGAKRAITGSARHLRAVFPAVRFGGIVFGYDSLDVVPLGTPEGAVAAAVERRGAPGDGSGPAAALRSAAGMEWSRPANKLLVVLPARTPGRVEAFESLQAARSFDRVVRSTVWWIEFGAPSAELTDIAARIDGSASIQYRRLSDESLVARDMLARLLGVENRERIERMLSEADD